MAELALRLLGPMCCRRHAGEEIAIGSKAARALVIYLALHPGERRSREELAAFLWPDRGGEQSRHSLRQTLFTYRQAFEDEHPQLLQLVGEDIWLDPSVDVDVWSFTELAREATTQSMNAAAALYDGELAAGFHFRSDPFERWLAIERTRLRDAVCQLMTRLVAQFSSLGDVDEAIRINRRLIEADPAREESHRSLMRLFAGTGRIEAALNQYRECARTLRRMLDANPEPETVTLLKEIRGGQVVPPSELTRLTSNRHIPVAAGSEAGGPTANVLARPGPGSSTEAGAQFSSDAVSDHSPRRLRRDWTSWFGLSWKPRAAIAVTALLILIAAALPVVRQWVSGPDPPPVRLSIVVLPFANLTGEPGQDYIADALTDDVTSDLSRIDGAFVIATGTAFTYKGKAIDVKSIGRDLGVRYVLQGALQSAEGGRRINVQLTDTQTAAILWSDKFVAQRSDFHRYQEEITGRIARALDYQVTEAESLRGQRERPTSPDSNDLVLRGRAIMFRGISPTTIAQSLPLFEAAVRADENNLEALSRLAGAHMWLVGFGMDGSGKHLQRADELVSRALELNSRHAYTHTVRGRVLLYKKKVPEALAAFDTALALNHNLTETVAWKGYTLIVLGRAQESVPVLERALRLNPRAPITARYYAMLGRADIAMGRYDSAVELLKRATTEAPANRPGWMWLAAALGLSNRDEEARAALAEFVKRGPGVTLRTLRAEKLHDEPSYDRIVDELRRLGLPE